MEHFRPNLRRSLDDSWNLFFAAPVVTILLAGATWAVAVWLESGKWAFVMSVWNALSAVGWTVLATIIVFTAVFLVHFLYLTPKRIIAETEEKLELAEDRADRLSRECENLRTQLAKRVEQPVFGAIDQLKALLREGTEMETAFQIPEKQNPTSYAIQTWIEKVNKCARQEAFAGIVGPKEVKKLNTEWHLHDVRRVQALLETVGYFDGVDDVGRLTFRTIWGHLKRLEELIDLIEGASETESSSLLGHVPSGAIGATAKSNIHERAAALIQLVDRRVQRINQLLEKDTPLLDAIANYAQDYKKEAERDAGFAELFEVGENIIQAARDIDFESNWESFGELSQLLITLNAKVREYNQDKVANLKNQVLHWSFQKVPEKLRDAKQELLSKRLW